MMKVKKKEKMMIDVLKSNHAIKWGGTGLKKPFEGCQVD